MEGFGSSDVQGPFNYGSVKDGYSHNPSLEQRLKKKYWKTKQTVRQKLNKREDEFVVAGDADIDGKLEKAQHLQTSCTKIIHATRNSVHHLRALSYYEQVLGNYLSSCGELDFTLAGQIMSKTGATHQRNAELRQKQLPAILRLKAETTTFATSGLGDLSYSIENLERARKEYRAGLLWMKDVSEKLHNPDAKGQLVRFREAQAHVKTTRENFEHLKGLLGEKIEMVSASRCNLLSNVLPVYQTATLEYLDQSANELFKVMTELRSQTQHQYKVKDLCQEIRDLEIDEANFETGPSEVGGEPSTSRDTPTEEMPNSDESKPKKKSKDDDALFGLLQSEIASAGSQNTSTTEQQSTPSRPEAANDTSGKSTEVSSDNNQSSLVEEHPPPLVKEDEQNIGNDTATPMQSNPPSDHLDGLLSLLDAPLDEQGRLESPHGGGGDEWDMFMTQQKTKDEEGEDDGGWGELVRHAHNNDDSNSGWSKSILDESTRMELDNEIDKLLSLEGDTKDEPLTMPTQQEGSDSLNLEESFDPLSAHDDSLQQATMKEEQGGDLQLDPSLFQPHPLPNPIPPPLLPQSLSPLALALPPTTDPRLLSNFPSSGMSTMAGSSGKFPMMGGASKGQQKMGGATGNSTTEEDKKKKNWMNVFAHLDPIANEKA